jgi:hypothetical protein
VTCPPARVGCNLRTSRPRSHCMPPSHPHGPGSAALTKTPKRAWTRLPCHQGAPRAGGLGRAGDSAGAQAARLRTSRQAVRGESTVASANSVNAVSRMAQVPDYGPPLSPRDQVGTEVRSTERIILRASDNESPSGWLCAITVNRERETGRGSGSW